MDHRGTVWVVVLLTLAVTWQGWADRPTAATAAWSQFLGPHRNGTSDETGLLNRWPADGPKEVWRVVGGVGMSGMVISRGQLVTMVQDEDKQYVIALDALTGQQRWRTGVAPAYHNSMGDGPRGTPAIVDDHVFAYSGEGVLTALKFATGEVVWRHDTVKELGGKAADYGMACSPLVVGKLVIVTPGAPDATVAAYDRVTGELTWKSGTGSAGYSSPALLNVGGREQVVAFTGHGVMGLDPQTGTSLWRYPYKTNYDCNIATPIAIGDRVFISAGEDHGCVLLSLTPAGDTFDATEVWQSQGKTSVMRNGWPTSILSEGRLYGLDNVGASTALTHLNCVDAATGKLLWQQKRFGNGNLIAADGKLILTTMKGELVLARMSPDGYDEIGRATVVGKTRQAAALSSGRVYLRDDREIVCIDLRESP
ncbi:MAG: PQQ-binding-like beta-propeller repeat protein [Phycisphaera sp.]|nr:PQQ-binding-like beta-propeller repeat protein [Phycisphaera sp.]